MGDESLITNNNLAVTGFSGTTSLGNETTIAQAVVLPTGVEGIGQTTIVNIWGLVDDSQTANYVEISTTQTPNWSEVA